MELDKQGRRWYKGNLHAHTTVTDGKMSPEDCIKLYQSKGYDFLAITDHWQWRAGEMQDNMLMISGVEYNIGGADVLKGIPFRRSSMPSMPKTALRSLLTPHGR